ncbi:MAG TPA: HD domain-containing protein [Puia sp.]|nr:HD domain-containing protein [Puia sp.]
MQKEVATRIADTIIDLYAHYGGEEYAGEKVTQLEHMVQAAQLARAQGYPDEIVLAAFLHDIGHIAEKLTDSNGMEGYGIKDHEAIGAKFLEDHGFSFKICRLVGSHVDAKRYLTRRASGYYDQLSEASRRTLEFQGGRMSEEEADIFEEDPMFREIIQMRRWDEAAKVEHQPVPDLGIFRKMIIEHLESQPG